ncbi:MAG: hypothetical protein JW788_04475 [Candidatus Omnitrophica bacterium]|nr:hypothetical protein [Candidatus Omnitrophota bacterium]
MKKKLTKVLLISLFFILGIFFVARLAGPNILRLYVDLGIGSCREIPLLCTTAEKEILNPDIDRQYLNTLAPYRFTNIEIRLPKEFTVINEQITRVYYKKKKRYDKGSVAYLLYEEPHFFVDLFPSLKRLSVNNNVDFLNHTMQANASAIRNIKDTFFVIVKTVFTPGFGGQKNISLIKYSDVQKKGFIAFSLGDQDNYFDCNLTDKEDNFFKVYIKDRGAVLDLKKVITIISTLKKPLVTDAQP